MKRFLSSSLAVIAISLAINTSVEAKGKPEVITELVVQVNNRTLTEYITPFAEGVTSTPIMFSHTGFCTVG